MAESTGIEPNPVARAIGLANRDSQPDYITLQNGGERLSRKEPGMTEPAGFEAAFMSCMNSLTKMAEKNGAAPCPP